MSKGEIAGMVLALMMGGIIITCLCWAYDIGVKPPPKPPRYTYCPGCGNWTLTNSAGCCVDCDERKERRAA